MLNALTEKDRVDLEFGLSRDVAYVALSLSDILKIFGNFERLFEKKKKGVKSIAKLKRSKP